MHECRPLQHDATEPSRTGWQNPLNEVGRQQRLLKDLNAWIPSKTCPMGL